MAPRVSEPAVLAALAQRLQTLVVDLELAEEARFVPADRPTGVDPSLSAVPVRRSDGQVEGHLYVRPGAQLELVSQLADLAGVAFGEAVRAQSLLAEARAARRVAERLQDALLPTIPEVAATTVEVRYRAASAEARVGGDFYDVFPLPNGRVLVVLGDVVGKGVEAATRTSRITQTFRALALHGSSLDELLAEAEDQVVFQDPEISATVWVGLYDPSSGELAFSSLGHPPALLVRAEGTPVWLETEGLPLGMRELAPGPVEIRQRALAPRDLLALYTDGMIESSGDVLEGLSALRTAVEDRRDEPLEAMPEAIFDALLADAARTDDALLLLMRRR